MTSTNGPPEPVFFIDESLGGSHFVSRLRLANLKVVSGLFRGEEDIAWLAKVAQNGWVAVTKDKLRSDLEEQVALVQYGVKVFVLIGTATHQDLAEAFLAKINGSES